MMNKEIEKARREICASYSTLRVADVCDALDALGLLDRRTYRETEYGSLAFHSSDRRMVSNTNERDKEST